MNLKLSLAQKLTASIAVAVAIQIALVIGSYFFYFEPRLAKSTVEVVETGVLANAQTYAAKWNYEILLTSDSATDKKLDTALQKNIREVLNIEKHVAGISIYRLSSGQGNKGQSRGKSRLVAHRGRTNAEYTVDLKRLGKMDKAVTFVLGNNAYAGIPVKVEDELVGYLIFARSIKSYYDEMKFFKFGMAGVMLVFFVMQLVVVFVLSGRSGRPVTQLAQTTAQIAAGDLTKDVKVEKHAVAEIQALSNAVLDMATAIHQQVSLIKSLTIKASGVSNNLSRAMSHLAGSASEQAAAVSQTATTVEQMESTGKNVVEAAKRIVEAAERSAEVSNRGRSAVSTASGVMTKIKEDSVNIAAHSRTLLANVEEVGNI
ncbi:MAG: methyl-accepting chemotaxis protein, partial [Deltaproteobacteria bacterium]|nr:methyl-accepting chemotaxis protein [Deltaproteobacteria bacterium]